jgi:hypothetical protein
MGVRWSIQVGGDFMTSRQNDYDSFRSKVKRHINKTVLLSVFASAGLGQSSAYGVDYRDALKLYAHSQLVSDIQYQCFYKLITKESNWRVNAKNGSHYGIGQMRNIKYKTLDGFKQVDWSIRYQVNRYGSPCNAWRFWLKNGYH